MRTLAVFILILLFIPLIVLSCFGWTVISIADNPTMIKNIIQSPTNYQTVLDATATYINFPENDKFALSQDEKNRILTASISTDDLDRTLNQIISDFYSWLHGNSSFIQSINLKPQKAKAVEALNGLFKEKYAALPECTGSDILLQDATTTMFPSCHKPIDSIYKSRFDDFNPTEISKNMIQDIPEAITFTAPPTILHLPVYYHYSKLILYFTSVFSLFLLTMIILFLRHWPKKLTRYLGVLGIIISLPILIPAYFGTDLLFQEISSNLNSSLSSVPKSIQDILTHAETSLVNQFADRLNIIALIFLSLGIISIIVSFFCPKYTKNYLPVIEDAKEDVEKEDPESKDQQENPENEDHPTDLTKTSSDTST